MNRHLLQTIALSAVALFCCASAVARPASAGEGETIYTYAPDGTGTYYGTGSKETMNAAIFVDGRAITGAMVVGLRFELDQSAVTSSGRITGWTTSTLKAQGDYNIPTGKVEALQSKTVGWNEIRFSEPVEVPAEGVYVGYSVIASTANCYPIGIGPNLPSDGCCFIFCPATFGQSWYDVNNIMDGITSLPALSMQVILADLPTGGMGIEIGSSFAGAQGRYIIQKAGEEFTYDVTSYNRTGEEINSVEYTYDIDGQAGGGRTVDTAITGTYGAVSSFPIELPAVEVGRHTLTVTVTKINGRDNTEADATAVATLMASPTEVKHRPIVEEYTGTWCEWCPSGYIGMLKMNRNYPEDFVGIAYHTDDPMDGFNVVEPNSVSGYPRAVIDRNVSIQPYYGEIETEWLISMKRPTTIGIEVAAELSEDKTTIEVAATVVSLVDMAQCDYSIGYILVADGLTGTGTGWEQSNKYSGDAYIDDDWAIFTEGGPKVAGLEFDDVAVLAPDSRGVEGSLPSSLTALEANAHHYTFTVAEAVNTSNSLIIQDYSKLRVMAVVLDGDGNAVNASKVGVSGPNSSVEGVAAPGREAEEVARYTIDGRRIASPEPGINIIKMSDGSARKEIVR